MPPQARLLVAAVIALLGAVAALGSRGQVPFATVPSLSSPGRAPEGGSSWALHLRAVEAALARENMTAAATAWQRAYGETLRSREWEPMLELGDAALRIGEAAGARMAEAPRARRAYLAALLHARDRRSLDGILRAAEAFAALGDREVVAESLSIAEGLAVTGGPAARERVSAARMRLAAETSGAEGRLEHPF